MSFISQVSSPPYGRVIAEGYGSIASPVSQIIVNDLLLPSIELPANFLNENYLLIESLIRRSALGFAPVGITAMWAVANNPAMTSGQSICNISIAATLNQGWRAFGVCWGTGTSLTVSTFQSPGNQGANSFNDVARDPSGVLYIAPRITAGMDIGDIVQLTYYRVSAFPRSA